MNFLGFFGSSLKSVKSPTYEQGSNHDSVDLQIKSLLYLFKRLRIFKLGPFLAEEENIRSFKYIDNSIEKEEESSVDPYFEKLDQMYNVALFKRKIMESEYRVMTDFIKNRFRSFCILSSYPSSIHEIPEGGRFPCFRDLKDRPIKSFRFIFLQTKNTNTELLSETLAASDIYFEHFHIFSKSRRKSYACEIIKEVLGPDRYHAEHFSISEEERARLVDLYLKRMAFNVQFNRLYSSYMKENLSCTSECISLGLQNSPNRAFPTIRSCNNSPIRAAKISEQSSHALFSPSKKRSLKNLRSSPPRSPRKELRSFKSIPNLKQNALTPSIHTNNANDIDEMGQHDFLVKNREVMSPIDAYRLNKEDFEPLSTQKDPSKELKSKCLLAINRKLEREYEVIFS